MKRRAALTVPGCLAQQSSDVSLTSKFGKFMTTLHKYTAQLPN